MEKTCERASRIIEEIIKKTSTRHYRLVLNEERQPGITDSKIGGRPYWPAGKDFPVDPQGNKMLLVMQVNCEQAGLQSPLPCCGMLQWFISVDPERMYGCKGNYNDDGTGCRIIYHQVIEDHATPADAPTHASVDPMLTPVKREVAIDVVAETTATGVNNGLFDKLFGDVFKQVTGQSTEGKAWYQCLTNDECLLLEQQLGMKAPCHQMLGYPVFTQEDARRDAEHHDALLFQLDSQFSTVDREELVMWGDMGSGYLFVNSDDLAALDFTRPYYCWDCG